MSRRSPSKREIRNKIFDINYAQRFGNSHLKVMLKKNFKGTSLFAKKQINRGNVIAYYRFKVNRYQGYTGRKKDMYTISIYTKSGRFNPHFIGDVFEGSLQDPKYNIPFWAYFSNEPSGDQVENAQLDINLKGNYRKRDKVKDGDVMVYKLVATKTIKPGEEICWCYGESYNRDYTANCS